MRYFFFHSGSQPKSGFLNHATQLLTCQPLDMTSSRHCVSLILARENLLNAYRLDAFSAIVGGLILLVNMGPGA